MPVSEETHGVRLDRVETEVQTITRDMGVLKTDMSGLKAGMRGLGDVLQRIEGGLSTAQQQWQDDKQASRINPIALATVLISIISILVGGAWLVSGSLARGDERSVQQQKVIDRMEQRQWLLHKGMGGPNGSAPEANTQ
jgi:hypothetical protein